MRKMKVRYTGDYYKVYLQKGQVYDAEYKDGFYLIYDADDDDTYGYEPQFFEVVEEDTTTLGA